MSDPCARRIAGSMHVACQAAEFRVLCCRTAPADVQMSKCAPRVRANGDYVLYMLALPGAGVMHHAGVVGPRDI
jgi:hypothetical protein